MRNEEALPALVATGIAGLDDVLAGGFTPNRVYLIEGNPGSGKTPLALRWLMEGERLGENCIYVTLSETKAELASVASSHGWSLNGISILELVAPESELEPDNQLAMFQPSEVELGVTTKTILAEVERTKPRRVVIDSLSEMRLLAQSPLRYRRQILALKQYFIGRECTVFLLDDLTSETEDLQLQSIAHGVVSLEQLSPEYGAERRRLRVMKLRGQKYRGGYHDFVIEKGGLAVFPRLIAGEHASGQKRGLLKADNEPLDALLGGGLQYGTSAVLLGPAGSGKSSLATLYARAAAGRGERAAIFAFDERVETLLERTTGLGMDVTKYLQSGNIEIHPIDTAELSPGEFAHRVRRAAEGEVGRPGVKVVVIDSLNGYLNAMPEERFLTGQLHELLTYLGHKGVVTFLVVAQHGLIGHMETPIDTTYLADTVILFRYFEAVGEVRQAISVLKKRSGKHERTIRELTLGENGINIGQPLRDFQGVLATISLLLGLCQQVRGACFAHPRLEEATAGQGREHLRRGRHGGYPNRRSTRRGAVRQPTRPRLRGELRPLVGVEEEPSMEHGHHLHPAADRVLRLTGSPSCISHWASAGPTALAALPGFPPDVMIVDLAMPMMNGNEVARRVRSMPELAGTKLVAMTGHHNGADREHSSSPPILANWKNC